MKPGTFLHEMRESAGYEPRDVVEALATLGLCGFNRTWPSRDRAAQQLARLERGEVEPTGAQLVSLAIVLSFKPSTYRRLLKEARTRETVDV